MMMILVDINVNIIQRWKQLREPVDPQVKEDIMGWDDAVDAEILRSLGIREECIL